MFENKYLGQQNKNIFHTSGYARLAQGGVIGSTSTETFERRRQIERNRRAVRRYGDSLIGRGHMREVAQNSTQNPMRYGGSYSPRSSVQAPPRTFHEPPPRYNPYA